MSEKETSDLTLSRKECSICGAVWLNGQHRWNGTGQKGDEESLSNLVCGIRNDPKCINPKHIKGHIYGEKDSWEKRRNFIDSKRKEIDDA
tara:strand:+ start:514 stop:783 length:270 start_codon:yes stop_codon:yes gene_type:complete